MAAPPGSAAALADHSGFTYQLLEAAKGLSLCSPGWPLEEVLLDELEELELLLELLELLEELLLEELLLEELLLEEELELLEELLLEELELLLEELELELELELSSPSPSTVIGTGETPPGVPMNPILTWAPAAISAL
jgi:hypothetical protein